MFYILKIIINSRQSGKRFSTSLKRDGLMNFTKGFLPKELFIISFKSFRWGSQFKFDLLYLIIFQDLSYLFIIRKIN